MKTDDDVEIRYLVLKKSNGSVYSFCWTDQYLDRLFGCLTRYTIDPELDFSLKDWDSVAGRIIDGASEQGEGKWIRETDCEGSN